MFEFFKFYCNDKLNFIFDIYRVKFIEKEN